MESFPALGSQQVARHPFWALSQLLAVACRAHFSTIFRWCQWCWFNRFGLRHPWVICRPGKRLQQSSAPAVWASRQQLGKRKVDDTAARLGGKTGQLSRQTGTARGLDGTAARSGAVGGSRVLFLVGRIDFPGNEQGECLEKGKLEVRVSDSEGVQAERRGFEGSRGGGVESEKKWTRRGEVKRGESDGRIGGQGKLKLL
ncbi:hypothetical protein CPLU01_09730 [Colletotrichum plurivorum]|uniref:Uncharacterized protein n=1 Tax=Colletotrichum plurivorum TaxID=2175906 RepID=A0A8H6K7W1_9PEZI|nr:hypothetical protein CPLU01_09730 [Colletotrichum plurivorum]